MVEEPVQNQGEQAEYVSEVVAPSPLGDSVVEEGSSNNGTEDRKRERREKDHADDGFPPLVWHKLSHDDSEGQLTGGRDPVADVGRDEGLNGLGT